MHKILTFFMSLFISISLANSNVNEYKVFVEYSKGFEYEIRNQDEELIIPNYKNEKGAEYKLLDEEYVLINKSVPNGYIQETKKLFTPDEEHLTITPNHIKNSNFEDVKPNNIYIILNVFVLIFFLAYILKKEYSKKKDTSSIQQGGFI